MTIPQPGSLRRESAKTSALLDPDAVRRLAAELSARDGWSRAALLELQRQRLHDLFEHAISASPYYRDAVGRGRVSLEDLPILTKTRLMDEWDRIVTNPRLKLADVEAHLAPRAGASESTRRGCARPSWAFLVCVSFRSSPPERT